MDSKLYKLGFLDQEVMTRRELQFLQNQLICNNCKPERAKTVCNKYILYPAIHREIDYGQYNCKPNIRYIF